MRRKKKNFFHKLSSAVFQKKPKTTFRRGKNKYICNKCGIKVESHEVYRLVFSEKQFEKPAIVVELCHKCYHKIKQQCGVYKIEINERFKELF